MENKKDPRFIRAGLGESLCSFCGNACNNGCSWSEKLVPVDGWTAIQNKNGYFVQKCPNFTDDGWMRENPDALDTEGCVRLMEAIIRKMRDDYILYPRMRPGIERFIRSAKARELFFFADPDDIIIQLRREMRHVT